MWNLTSRQFNFIQWFSFRSFWECLSWRNLQLHLPLCLLVEQAVSSSLQTMSPKNLLCYCEWPPIVKMENFCKCIRLGILFNQLLRGVLFEASYYAGLYCRSALGAFRYRLLYANVSYDRILISVYWVGIWKMDLVTIAIFLFCCFGYLDS